jgi:(S)-ureidoglycine aminohydrolase
MIEQSSPPPADIVSRSRSVVKPSCYLLLAHSSKVWSSLPHWRSTRVCAMATPQLGAKFVEYELAIESGGGTAEWIDDGLEQFFFVLEGEIEIKTNCQSQRLTTGGYMWLPPKQAYALVSPNYLSRVIWLRRHYQIAQGIAIPHMVVGNERDISPVPVRTFQTQHLLPKDDLALDMAVNILNFTGGIHFTYVEVHVMEHGLYMLEGRGVYHLSGDFLESEAGDFIYMAPYCPQFFYATGWGPSRYLLYKDANRDYAFDLGDSASRAALDSPSGV